MNSRILVLLSTAAIFAPSLAVANPSFSRVVDLGFATATKVAVQDQVWSAGLSALFTYDWPGPNLQLSGNYDHIDANGSARDFWAGSADAFWRDSKGTIGASVGYGSINTSNFVAEHLVSYGGFSEWYALRYLTLRVKVGAFTGPSSGWYAGGGYQVYVLPDLSVNGTYNYTRTSNSTHVEGIDINAEYLISRNAPVSVALGYERSETELFSANAFMARIHLRFGSEGSLVQIDRNGPLYWGGRIPL